jgi:S-adenosylmethionine synthetase
MTFEEPEYIDKVIDEISDRLLGAPIQEKTKTRIKNEVLQGASEDYYTQLVRTYNNNPTEDNKNTLSNRIENLFGALFQLGEIHLF